MASIVLMVYSGGNCELNFRNKNNRNLELNLKKKISEVILKNICQQLSKREATIAVPSWKTIFRTIDKNNKQNLVTIKRQSIKSTRRDPVLRWVFRGNRANKNSA
jgi:hypothetical protein